MKWSNCIFKGQRDEFVDVVEILDCGCAQAAGYTSEMSFWINFGKYFSFFKKIFKIFFYAPAVCFGLTDKIIFLQFEYL